MEPITYIPRFERLAATPVRHGPFDLVIVTVGSEPLMFSREQIELLFERREEPSGQSMGEQVGAENDLSTPPAPAEWFELLEMFLEEYCRPDETTGVCVSAALFEAEFSRFALARGVRVARRPFIPRAMETFGYGCGTVGGSRVYCDIRWKDEPWLKPEAAPLGAVVGGAPVVFVDAVDPMPAQPLDPAMEGISDVPPRVAASRHASRRDRQPSAEGEVVWSGAKARADQMAEDEIRDPAAKSKVDLVRVSLRSLGEASIGDVHADLTASEIKMSRSDVATNLSYLLKRGELKRTANGRYKFA